MSSEKSVQKSDGPPSQGHLTSLLVLLLLVGMLIIAAARIADTYRIFNHTYDEQPHIAAGLEYLDAGKYEYEPKHPPMRAVLAVGPMLRGARHTANPDLTNEGHQILYDHGDYFSTLTSARVAVLPFFVATIVLVFCWGLQLGGRLAALCAAGLYSTLPLALAHGGLATTDTLVTATLTGALFAWAWLLKAPSAARFATFGFTAGLALVSKLSALVFGAQVVVVTGLGWLLGAPGFGSRSGASRSSRLSIAAKGAVVGAVACMALIWTVYQFSVAPLSTLAPGAGIFGGLPIPAPEFWRGIYGMLQHNSGGHLTYFMGEINRGSNFIFFPVAIAVKTPIPFLILAAIGSWLLVSQSARRNNPLGMIPPIAAALILLISMASRINIGLRHLLPMFPLLAICAGVAAADLWRRQKNQLLFRFSAAVLLCWQAYSSIKAHPDYLAYFNECCDGRGERWLVDSDLDWGQDLTRLSNELKARGVSHVYLAYFGTADPRQHHLPSFTILPRHQEVRGWVAISEWQYVMGTSAAPNDQYRWLRAHRPVARVGKSIRLYFIP